MLSMPASFGMASLAAVLLPEGWFGESAAKSIGEQGPWRFLVFGVLFGPAWETLIGQCAPVELLRRLRAPPLACVITSAGVFGAAHWMGGGLGHGLSTLVSGSVFALAYWLCRPAGFWCASTAAYVAHAAHNCLTWFVLGPLLGA
ncbi:hypothetical protein J2X20_002816 [Pelomonas saccharophila]|uniref:CAAX prenyl protease 2/Lysostaphin resistance protein A-like domain-containing protein n=1 Tax=Roseateles saccharophilus TaxID=304 RepID=A0ABU1YMR8_ROSSA|nr:CPBP family glutamic-type intramembrane protease [Roseateles saccharophilus]MDR7270158.1 hypothetical protein [Roseateles saccharophilus]